MKVMKKIVIPLYIAALIYANKDVIPSPEELLTIEFIITSGIDVTLDESSENKCGISFITGEGKSGDEKSGGEASDDDTDKSVFNVESATLSGAMEKVQSLTNKSMSSAHMRYILVGQETADENLDYFLRYYANNPKIRPDVNVFLLKDTTSRDFLRETLDAGIDLNERLDGIVNNKSGEGYAVKKNIKDMLQLFYSDEKSGVIPVLSLEKNPEESDDDKNGNRTFDLYGLGIIKGGVLKDYIPKNLLQPYLVATNKYSGGEVTVTEDDGDGGTYVLKIKSAKTKVKYNIDGGELKSVRLDISVDTDFKESDNSEDVFSEQNTAAINESLGKKIFSEILMLLELSKVTESDFMELDRQMEISHPYKYAELKESGKKVLKDFDIEVNVSAKLKHFYTVNTEYIKK